MPVIDFPSNPSNNELFIAQGKAMRYNSDKNKWRQVTTLTSNQITELEGKTIGISSMSISGNTLVIQKDDSTHANVSLSAFAGNILTNYASASQLPTTGLVAGSQVYVTDTDSLFITDGSGWYKIATVNLSPSLSLGVSSISMSGGGTVDVNYTVNEPEDTPYTITASATSNATITVHQSNNTLSFVAGGASSSETITITATDGVNTVADTLTMEITVLSYSSFTRTAVYGQSSMTGVFSSLEFGATSNISNNGLVATFGMPMRHGNGKGAIAVFTNTSGDTSNTTSWTYLTELDVPTNLSYANNGGSSALGSTNYWNLGMKDHCISADGSMIAAHYNRSNTDSATQLGTVIWERSGSSYNIHSIFNPWALQNTTTTRTNLRDFGQRISCDATMTRIAVPWHGYVGNSITGRVDVYVRSGTTWTHEQTLSPFGNYNTPVNSYGPYGIWSHGHISMSADGTRIVYSYHSGYKSGDGRGMMYIWHRSGTTWSEEFESGQNVRYYFGNACAMSGDGNHIIVTQSDLLPLNGSSNTQRLKYYQWSGTNWSYQGEMNPQHLIPNPDFGPANYHPWNGDRWGVGCSLNYDGTICTVVASEDDGYNNPTGASNTGAITTYKRYDTTGATGNKPNNGSYWYFDKYMPMFESANYNPNLGMGSTGGWGIDAEGGALSGDGKVIVMGSTNYNVGDEHLKGKGIIIQPT